MLKACFLQPLLTGREGSGYLLKRNHNLINKDRILKLHSPDNTPSKIGYVHRKLWMVTTNAVYQIDIGLSSEYGI
jgi:hypothetical protein